MSWRGSPDSCTFRKLVTPWFESVTVLIASIYNCGMTGFSRGQGVLLHIGLHQLGTSTNPNRCFIDYNSRVHRPPRAAELICFRTLAMAYIPLNCLQQC